MESYCQSCGMPLGTGDALLGTEKDGTKNGEYCKYCYDRGAFTSACTMEEMIDFCVGPMLKEHPEMTEEKARAMMEGFFPSLKRWKA